MADRTLRLSGETSVYRYYDRHELLIYVGITGRGGTRNSEHNKHAAWWPYVVRQEVDHLETRELAERRENALILEYRPPFNTQHNPDAAITRAAYLAWSAAAPSDDDLPTLLKQIRRTLPLTPLEQDPSAGRLVLRTDPNYYPIVSRLQPLEPGRRFTVGGQQGVTVRALEKHGMFALLHIRGRRTLPVVATATATIRFASQKPIAFRLSSVELATPDAPRLALPKGGDR